jgi:hypothetical protein
LHNHNILSGNNNYKVTIKFVQVFSNYFEENMLTVAYFSLFIYTYVLCIKTGIWQDIYLNMPLMQ